MGRHGVSTKHQVTIPADAPRDAGFQIRDRLVARADGPGASRRGSSGSRCLADGAWGIIGGVVSDDNLRDSVIDALGEDAVPVDVLRSRLGAPWDRPRGGRDELDRLLQLDTSFTEVSDGFVFVPALVEGTAWTVWVDSDDGADGFVRMHPALSALGWWLIGDDVELVDDAGRRLGVLETDGWMLDDRDTDVVLGPDGWLDGLVGRWARVEVVGGALRWSALEGPPPPTPAQIAAIRVGFDRAVRDDESQAAFDAVPMPAGLRFASGEGPIHEALFADRRAFVDDPVPPLTDLYAAAGLVQRDATHRRGRLRLGRAAVVADPQPAHHLLRPRHSPGGRRGWAPRRLRHRDRRRR